MDKGVVLQVHRTRFLHHDAQAIHCLAFSTEEDLAVARSDGSIELWRRHEEWYPHGVIPGRRDSSIEVLQWSYKFLYSAGLDGCITHWDADSLQSLCCTDTNGGAIWCMSPSPASTVLAIGCEDGCVHLYDLAKNGTLHFTKKFGHQNGRILSLAWDPDQDIIYTGSIDSTIRRYNVSSGQSDLRITLDDHRGQSTLVWCLQAVGGHTLLSGDSTGKINVWDGLFGTMKQSYEIHLADVLAMVVSKDRKTVFAAGIDQKVVCLKQTMKGNTPEWHHCGEVVAHTHDVRSLALSSEGLLVSGGVDTTFVEYDLDVFKKSKCTTVYPFLSNSHKYQICDPLILHQRQSCVELWRLADCITTPQSTPTSSAKPTPSSSTSVTLARQHCTPICPLRLNLPDAVQQNLVCSATAPDRSVIGLATSDTLWLYQFEEERGAVKLLTSCKTQVTEFVFLSDKQLLLATPGGLLLRGVIERPSEEAVLKLSEFSAVRSERVTKLLLNSSRTTLAVIHNHSFVVIYNLKKTCHFELPKLSLAASMAAFHPSKPLLFLACVNRQIVHLNCETEELGELIAPFEELENGFVHKWGPLIGLAVVECKDHHLLTLASQSHCIYVNLKSLLSQNNRKSAKLGKKRKTSLVHSITWSKLHDQGDVIITPSNTKIYFLAKVKTNELVFGEKHWEDITSDISQPIFRKRYKT